MSLPDHLARVYEEDAVSRSRVLEEAREPTPLIADDTVVTFEGKRVRWGNLTLQDRKAYMAGGYPF